MWWPPWFRVAVALILLMCCCGRYPPSSRWPSVGRADATSAVRSGGAGSEKDRSGAGGGVVGGGRWKHKGVGVGIGGGGIRSSHRRPSAADRRPEMDLNVGMLMPKTSFGVRGYLRAIHDAIQGINKAYKKNHATNFTKIYDFEERNVRSQMMSLTPSPTAILNSLCKEFLNMNVSAILYLMNYEKYGRSTASAQYFLQLAGYLGIPVIAWNADNSGLERRASRSSLQLQLAPSLEHQTAAMLSILERYKWHQFSVVTSQIAGHDDFIQAVRERVADMQDRFKFTILNSVLVTKNSDLQQLVASESRVMLLYCTREEALRILQAARGYKITGENYVWVVTQSVMENLQAPQLFPVGMLGVHFDTSSDSLVKEITTAIRVFAHGVEDFVNDPQNINETLTTQLSCEGEGESRWVTGEKFYKYLRNVSVEHTEPAKPKVEFTADGVLKSAELKIMNLRPGVGNSLVWEEIGVWKSWEREGLYIKDIVWPGDSHTPPQGVPEKFNLRITFLEEAPYITLAPPDPITGKCSMNRGVLCRIARGKDLQGVDVIEARHNSSYYQCCSGFCIDLLEKFAEDLGFTYELVRVEDGKWGTLENGKWNGLISELVNRKTDMVMTSLMINSDRESVVDFSLPFMETGISIAVTKRTGIISPTAFLEPFDTASWMLVGVVAIQAATFSIFAFEWMSPSGFDMKSVSQAPNHRFSLFRTYWLIWAVLFQAAVQVDIPKGITSRFMTNIWAMFAVVFLAIYTANLAAFMITREEYYDFMGIDDYRLSKPHSHKPMFKFGTVPHSHIDSTIHKYFPEMFSYMKSFNRSTVQEGLSSLLTAELDAFIYDGTVLDYLVTQDDDCRLLTVGSWYAKTGYAIAFQRNSKYVQMFNKRLLDFRENGDLERLQRFWMTGTCKPDDHDQNATSDPLALEQFLSAFLLLMGGTLLAALILLLECLYFNFFRKKLAKTDQGGCCALISLSMGKSLTFRGAVFEAQDFLKFRRCKDAVCDSQYQLLRNQLMSTYSKMKQLEKELELRKLKSEKRRKKSMSPSARLFQCITDNHDKYPDKKQYQFSPASPLRQRDLVRPSIISTEYTNRYDHEPVRTEIAEMETVL
ncbi:PREDICTED: glutamate receptor ionotropic, NMDA 2B isoform X2 [Diuraphis noxia]|uniref:glutamate receptor ionotropic, NMDA 2B isoform X2 n=1 Tax=Diuraphis noxia TaxID=143948 RepID=UPI0007636E06|nr:PREDICTED: glutamate receptor ionotropic, NMDA 2B isoform X2 [Diuraphis noxia]